jgi:N-acetylglucosaminyl-diphospho-decaprenol L-rhamnosyltransferase
MARRWWLIGRRAGGGDVKVPEVGVVVVTFNALPYLERCLDSVHDYQTVVVDHGSDDGTLEFVRERFPDVTLLQNDNRGLAAGWASGIQALGSPRYLLIINADAWVMGDAVEHLVAFADAHPDAAIIGPQLRNPDGTLQRSVRGFPSVWRLATEYLVLRRLTLGLRPFAAAAGGGIDHTKTHEADWVVGAALLVRSQAVRDVGLPDAGFFLFGEEVDWCYRFKRAGWKVVYYPGARVTHVGGTSHGGLMVRELARSNLRYMAKHHGERSAERARKVMLAGTALRALLYRGEKRGANLEAARWLRSPAAAELLSSPSADAEPTAAPPTSRPL